MCGIAGIVDLDGGVPEAGAVERMLAAIVHRGPDSSGTFSAPGVRAGIRRLRVVDLATGDQPIASEDGAVEVVFNGEIYNHLDLRRALESRGHRFRTRADTEVLVHLWEDEGPEMLSRLNGMFAFCLVDRRSGEVFLARDRLGVKPLYLREAGRTIVFASELPALAPLPAPDPERLVDLLMLQYVPGDATIYPGVRKLPPGHALRIRSGAAERRRWWAVPEGEEEPEDPAARLRALMEDSVRLEREADVPVGVFLSGGLDSSIVATLLAEAGGGVETFSVGFEDAEAFDERRHARAVAEAIGARHHELVLSAGECAALLPSVVAHLEEPVVDPALLPTYLLSKFARERVTVALAGEGADELFAGYRRYRWQRRYAALGRVPGIRAFGARLPGRRAQAAEALAERDPARNHLLWSATMGQRLSGELLGEEPARAWLDRTAERFRPMEDTLRSRLTADLTEWLPNNLLLKVDRASMAFSLEARVPFLDHRVVELAARLPERRKLRGGTTKVVLREAFAERLPTAVLARPKAGFDLPLASWMRGPLLGEAKRRLASGVLEAAMPLRPGAAGRLLEAHARGDADAGLPLFSLLSIAIFLDRHV